MPSLAEQQRQIEGRSKSMARALHSWLVRFGRDVMSEELRRAGLPAVNVPIPRAKGKQEQERLMLELRQIIDRFGLQQAGGRELLVQSGMLSDFLTGKVTRIKGIARATRQKVRSAAAKVIADAVKEVPRPSPGAIAQRLRDRFDTDKGLNFALSPQRAALIARTELAQAENMGIMAGYRATGVKEIEWIAYRDGRSGNRHHERMHGQRRPVGKRFWNEATQTYLRYPGDPRAPIGETANCRCTTRPVREKS